MRQPLAGLWRHAIRPSSNRVYFLVFNAHGSGGVARTVLTLAGWLAEHGREVEVLSLRRRRERPSFKVHPGITLTHLDDVELTSDREIARRERLLARRTRVRPDPFEEDFTAWDDHLLRRALWSRRPGVVITARPSLHLAASRLTPPHHVLIAQDHLNYVSRTQTTRMIALLEAALPGLDRFQVLTEADAADYRRLWPGVAERVVPVPNASSFTVAEPVGQDSRTVVAAGRLNVQKDFSRLLDAYAPVARRHPDWQLHIHGKGPERRDLREKIGALGLGGQVRLMGHTAGFQPVLASAAILAMSSQFEGFPMVLVEAMTKGVPMVAFDCPRGPAEIIEDGVNGRLVPDGDLAGYTQALLDLIEDDEARRAMAEAATAASHRFTPDVVGHRWETLIDEAVAGHPRLRRRPPAGPRPGEARGHRLRRS